MNFSDWVYIFNRSVVFTAIGDVQNRSDQFCGQKRPTLNPGVCLCVYLGGSWTLYAEDNDLSHFVVIIMDMLVQEP